MGDHFILQIVLFLPFFLKSNSRQLMTAINCDISWTVPTSKHKLLQLGKQDSALQCSYDLSLAFTTKKFSITSLIHIIVSKKTDENNVRKQIPLMSSY